MTHIGLIHNDQIISDWDLSYMTCNNCTNCDNVIIPWEVLVKPQYVKRYNLIAKIEILRAFLVACIVEIPLWLPTDKT